MKRRFFLLGLIAAPASAQDALQAVQELYRSQLAPLGDWRDVAGLGMAWRPAGLPRDWRPFSLGRWRYTMEGGWYWQGDLPFAAIAEHRGRWRRVDGQWWWLPGTRFDPAPVAWGRAAGGTIAWAPLPTGERRVEGWSLLPLAELASTDPAIRPASKSLGIRRVAPPDPSDVEAAGGKAVQPASLGELVSADDLTAWYATDTRSVRGIADPRLRLPSPARTPRVSGPAGADDAWAGFERQHQRDLEQNQILLEEQRRQDRNDLR
jgi:hypothetical protein